MKKETGVNVLVSILSDYFFFLSLTRYIDQ